MYNRYIPQDTSYTKIETDEHKNLQRESGVQKESGPLTGRILGSLGGLRDLFTNQNGEHRTLSGLIKNLDSGDVLLLLIAILLLVEGEDVDLAVALGLVFLLGLGDGNSKHEE